MWNYILICLISCWPILVKDGLIKCIKVKVTMGRKSDIKVRNYFEYNASTLKSKCNICDLELSGCHLTNLKRHLYFKHKNVLENTIIQNCFANTDEVQKKKKKICFEISKEDFVDSIIKIVTKDGRPFKHLDSEGFMAIVTPIYAGLGISPISSFNIMEHVDLKLQYVKNEIRLCTKGRLVSLKIDSATRMDRSILGVNLQFIEVSQHSLNIAVKTLAMVHLFERQTGQFLKEKILEILADFEIQLSQIYSITSDNGRNMLKTIEMLNECNELSEDLDEDEIMESVSFPNIQSIRCAAHTLQLCVNDIHKDINICQKIENGRKLCKALRTPRNRRKLNQFDICIPPIDIPTRWNSTYLMLKKLFDIKLVLLEQEIVETEIDWEWVENYIGFFEPVWIATLRMQQEQLVLSDFFKIWMELKLHYQNSSCELKTKFLDSLNNRELMLLDNIAMLSAIYLDPRLNLILNRSQKSLAKAHLKKIAKNIINMKQNNNSTIPQEENATLSHDIPTGSRRPSYDADDSLLCLYLNNIEQREQNTQQSCDVRNASRIYADIENFEFIYPRLPLDSNILSFFDKLKLKSPDIFELALVVLGVPATQVTVERAFSSLKFILSEKRYNLSSKTLQSLLLVKLNT